MTLFFSSSVTRVRRRTRAATAAAACLVLTAQGAPAQAAQMAQAAPSAQAAPARAAVLSSADWAEASLPSSYCHGGRRHRVLPVDPRVDPRRLRPPGVTSVVSCS